MPVQSLVGRLIRGLASLATLLVLLVGVPFALWALARWPLPAGLPSPGDVTDALSQERIPDSTLIKVIALVGWLAWMQIAVSLVVETVAWVAGRPAPHLAVAGPIQPAVRRLLASAALLLGGANLAQPAHASALHDRPPPVVAIAETHRIPIDSDGPAFLAGDDSAPAPPEKTYTVVRRDTLWGLAERHLGDPLRWREIYDLNRGKPQGEGRSLEDPNLIIPGWVFTFPADATGLGEPAAANPQPAPTASASEPLSEPTASADCDPSPSAAPTTPETNTAPPSRAVTPTTALAAASVVALLARLRRVQQRRRRPGRRPRPPAPYLEPVERGLRRAADLETAERLDLALRAFAAGVTRAGDGAPLILAVRVGTEQVELLLADPPAQPPKGFQATGDQHGWITEPDLTADDLRAIANGHAAPLPALVTLGQLDGDHLLVDLETAGVLTIGGVTAAADSSVRSIAMQLATSTWVDHVDVLLVGAATLDIAGASRVRHLSNLDEAADELAAIAQSIDDALVAAECSTTLHARCSDQHDDGWIPTVLVCAQEIDAATLARFVDIARGGNRGVAVVARSSMTAAWHAHLTETELLLSPLGFRITPDLVDADSACAIDELLADAVVADDEPIDAIAAAETTEPATTPIGPFHEPPFEVEVRILGPVEVAGSEAPLDRHKSVEMTAYLALHPNGVTDERLKTILWPDALPKDGTFNTNVSMTRSRLGRASNGDLHLPHKARSGNVYRLGVTVTTDLARFEARVAHSKRCSDDAITLLHDALELVRGQPFEGARGFEWAFSEGLVAATEAAVADAAHALAQLYLAAGDPPGATWAANQGLKASPGDEILYRDRMLACDLAGNPAGVETVMDELCEVVEALEPFDTLHPETLELYERISHRKRTRTAPGT